jgi:type II secretory pathway predicted ATPase ExeA
MYDGCLGLNRRPFVAVPQIDHYFPAAAIEGARATLARCIQRGEGAGLVVGPSGTGKTLLCLLLAEQFRRSFEVVMLQSGRLSTRRALFQAILYELGRPYRGMDEGEARLAVVDHLMADDGSTRGMVLLVDEAHTMPLRLVEEIRLLSNLVRDGQPLVRLVLAGGPVLEERFASPKLDSFSQRLTARCYLEALNRTETEEYIQSQINLAGGHGDHIFPQPTCQSVFQATGGVPRLINQVCDHALVLAYVAGRQRIEPANIEEAWGDLQQLPTPWSGEPQGDPTGGVIEFGALDDQADTSPDLTAGATASIPALRVTPSEDEHETDEAEPAQQIHRIERLLAEADDDFQPAGSIGPEMELCFEELAHPFQEPFEHEEVVADRYAAAAVAPAAPLACQSETTVPEPERAERDESASWETPDPAPLPAESEGELVCAGASVPDGGSFGVDEEQERRFSPPVAPSPDAPTRRREYRQLFARLRRG